MFESVFNKMAGEDSEGSATNIKNYFGQDIPDYATDIMLQTNEVCKENLEKLYDSSTYGSPAWCKRILHFEVLSNIIAKCKPEHKGLVEDICKTFKSPKKWQVNVYESGEPITGMCEYANFGTLHAKESGITFIYPSGVKVCLVNRPANM